jgi:hypothetical protein
LFITALLYGRCFESTVGATTNGHRVVAKKTNIQ